MGSKLVTNRVQMVYTHMPSACPYATMLMSVRPGWGQQYEEKLKEGAADLAYVGFDVARGDVIQVERLLQN